MDTRVEKSSKVLVDTWFDEDDEQIGISTEGGTGQRQEPISEKYERSQLHVVRETKDYQLDYLRYAQNSVSGLIDNSPAYQRRLRWSDVKKSRLIESFLLNIPVPPIYLYERDYNLYEVIDGRQRLEAIDAFLTNKLRLRGLEYWVEENGKTFSELPPILRKGLLRRSIPAVVLLAENKDTIADDLDVRRVLFNRLNTGGVQLNAQELRNALYPGPFNHLLIELARTDAFADTWGIPRATPNEAEEVPKALLDNKLYSQLKDAELVLRFFALRDAIQTGRTGSLRRILDRYMAENANPSDRELEEMREVFMATLARLRDLFEGAPFQLPETNRVSRPLYDALMVALSLKPNLPIEHHHCEIREALESALRDQDKYNILVGRGNTIAAVRERVDLAGDILRVASS